jgi:hypothetical protein
MAPAGSDTENEQGKVQRKEELQTPGNEVIISLCRGRDRLRMYCHSEFAGQMQRRRW